MLQTEMYEELITGVTKDVVSCNCVYLQSHGQPEAGLEHYILNIWAETEDGKAHTSIQQVLSSFEHLNL